MASKGNETWVTINGNHVCINSKTGTITKGPDALKGMTVTKASKATRNAKKSSSTKSAKKSTTKKSSSEEEDSSAKKKTVSSKSKSEETKKETNTKKEKPGMVYIKGEWAVIDENGIIQSSYHDGIKGLNWRDTKSIDKAIKESQAPVIKDIEKEARALAKKSYKLSEDERESLLLKKTDGMAYYEYQDAFYKAFDKEVKAQKKAHKSTTTTKSSSTTKASTKTTEKKNSSTNSHISKTGLEVVHYDGFGGGSHNVYYINGKRVSAKEAKSKYPSQFNSRGWYEGNKGGTTKSTSSSTSTKKQRNYTKSTADVMKSFNTKSTKELQSIVTKSDKVLKDKNRYPDSQIDYSWQKAYTEQKAARKLLDSKTARSSTTKKKSSGVSDNFTGWKGNKYYFKGQWVGMK